MARGQSPVANRGTRRVGLAFFTALAVLLAACTSSSTEDGATTVTEGAIEDAVTSSGCPEGESSDVGASSSSTVTSLLRSTLGDMASGAASAAGSDLFGWVLTAVGVGGGDGTAILNQISTELQQIETTLVDICVEISEINTELQALVCANDADWLATPASKIDNWYNLYLDYVIDIQEGKPPSSDTIEGWADDVLDQDTGALFYVTQLKNLGTQSTSGGSIHDCIQKQTSSLGKPQSGTLDDRPYYEAVVAPIQNWFYGYNTKAFVAIAEAYHYRAWLAAGSPTGEIDTTLPDVCDTGTTSTTLSSTTTTLSASTTTHSESTTSTSAASTTSTQDDASTSTTATDDSSTSTQALTTTTEESTTTTKDAESTTTRAPEATTTTSSDLGFDCIQSQTIYDNQILPWLIEEISAGGAPYSTELYLIENGWPEDSSATALIATNLEDYTAAAGGNCTSPLESSDHCGPLVGPPGYEIPSVQYGPYGGDAGGKWVSVGLPDFNELLAGFRDLSSSDTETTAAGWLCTGKSGSSTTTDCAVETNYGIDAGGLEYANKIIVFDKQVDDGFGTIYPGAKTWCFFDGSIARNHAAQPFCDAANGSPDYGNLLETHDPSSLPSGACTDIPNNITTVEHWKDSAEWTRSNGPVSSHGFYSGILCEYYVSGSNPNSYLEWDTPPPYGGNPESYHWPQLAWPDVLVCTDALDSDYEGTSAGKVVNPGGVPTMCGDDYSEWLEFILPILG